MRQHYVIDADLQSATMDSIYNAEVKVDKAGNVILSPVGGRRRIDFVLYHRHCPQVLDDCISVVIYVCVINQTSKPCFNLFYPQL